MYAQPAPGRRLKKEHRIGFEALAAVDPAGAAQILAAPIVAVEWLFRVRAQRVLFALKGLPAFIS